MLKDQLLVRSLDSYSAYLPSAFDKESFAFYGTALSGTPEQEARWKRAVDFTVGALTDDVSKLYVERYFPPETKAAADELVKNVVAAMGRRIEQLTWMQPETKVRAQAKLANFITKIGYPEPVARLFAASRSARGDALGNAMRAAEWSTSDAVQQARRTDPPVGVGHDPDDDQRLCQFRHARDRLPGRDPAAALLRSARRPGDQLWRHRRRDRPRDQPPFRRPGREI